MAKSNKGYEDNRGKLAQMLKTEAPAVPMQEVRPVTPKKEVSETHVNFWAPTELVQKLKIHSVKSGKSIKQLSIEAIEEYLKRHD